MEGILHTLSARVAEPPLNDLAWNPRIPPTAFVASIFTLLAIAVTSTLARSFLRYRAGIAFGIDDVLLFISIATLAGGTGVVYSAHNFIYLQVATSIRIVRPPPDFLDKMRVLVRSQQAASMLVWATIYLVKLSFMLFFYRLVQKIKRLETWWRVVFVLISLAGLVSVPLGWIVCANTGPDMFTYCPVDAMGARENVYLKVTTSLDIFTDCLVISVPIMTLWRVRITASQKFAIGSILSLSSVMVVIAIVRISLHQTNIPGHAPQTDTAWLFFWQFAEAATAVVMVSLTAFRSLYGQAQARTKTSKGSDGQRRYGRMAEPMKSDSKSVIGEERVDSAGVHSDKSGATLEDIEFIPLKHNAV